ncbi:D-sedoheptulose 7-phosphate isomerase [Geosporobacter subterraneus DSM 17957]|uniref:D-sedoheptulose 7-phosphate isomerase n=1 Tax=Geosporobacter subterraneus DSM 17957 TaxID=1121919 RepID=A0A1M6I257_9FIRM|nr:SIS domain-containing protein [Geosporobacter subterraneus]SHJ28541.1 D-sedoheptulose 7-phosphate isomerase [Geosporobacter subterraneus DSM 17957]
MEHKTEQMLKEFKEKYPVMAYLEEEVRNLIDQVVHRIKSGGKILVCGNGGSAADSEHIVGELLKEFYIKRPVDEDFRKKLQEYVQKKDFDTITACLQGAIPAISLVSQTGFLTAYGNDVSFEMAYAQQVYAYGEKNDVLIGLSTSGNASNLCYAAKVAKAKELLVVSFTGESGGKLKELSDILLNVPAQETFKVQEYHLPLYHFICRALEYEIFGGVL